MSAPRRIKEALAKALLDIMPEGFMCDPYDLDVNRGANRYNDWVSWGGYVTGPNGVRYMISSWDTMTELVKASKRGGICIIGGKMIYGDANEISTDN